MLARTADAQIMSDDGRFSVNYTQGCVPYDITITDNYTPSNATGKSWFLLYENETQEIEITSQVLENGSFTVTEPRKLTIIQWTTIDENGTPRLIKDYRVVSGYAAAQPVFSVYSCSNLGGVAEIQAPTYDYYEVRFGTNPQAVRADASTNFTATGQFLTAGENTVTVRGFYNNAPNNCGESATTVEARAQLPTPEWNGLQWDPAANTVALQYSLDPQVRYQLEVHDQASGTFTRYRGLSSTSADTTLVMQDLASRYYCFRITALDECNGSQVSSPPICTAAFTLRAQDGANEVAYQTSPQFAGTLMLLRSSGEVVTSSGTASGTFRDEDIVCQQEYCYQLQLQPAGTAQASSSTVCVEAVSNRPLSPIRNISSTWPSNEEVLFVPQFSIVVEDLNLSLLSEEGKRIAASRGDQLHYRTGATSQCYLFTYGNQCATQAAIPTRVCPLFLENKGAAPDAFVPAWNEYIGYEQGVSEYILEEVDEAGEYIQGWNVGTELQYSGFATFTAADNGRRFRVLALPVDNTVAPSYSNIFTYELVMKGYFPNAFSPNDDGLNDEFKILGKFVDQASIWVFNRWGEQLFHTTDKEVGWSGTKDGTPLPAGTYVYKAEVLMQDGKKEILSGTIFLKR
jgi:gliding motility-associated-like protein